ELDAPALERRKMSAGADRAHARRRDLQRLARGAQRDQPLDGHAVRRGVGAGGAPPCAADGADVDHGTPILASSASMISSGVRPAASASKLSSTRCLKISCATSWISSGVTKSRPASHALAREQRSRAIVARGLAPYCRTPARSSPYGDRESTRLDS